MRTAREVTLPLRIDQEATASIPTQLVEGLRALLTESVLTPGDALPSSRALAAHLGIARGSVVTAYEQLVAEGWFDAAAGRSTIVNPRLHEVHPRDAQGPGTTPMRPMPRVTSETSPADQPGVIDLRPGRPHQAGVVGAAWRAAWRRAAEAPVDVTMPPLGWPDLRLAIAEHLRLMRAVVRDPADIAVTAGGREGLTLLLAATGARTVGVEDPGYPSLRRVLREAGATIRPLPADSRGLITADLPDDAPDVVIVTPSHQYPLGGSLPIDRRQQLLAWAQNHDVLIVEDDYDSELRYTSAPLPALTSLDHHGRVALLGTFAKTLTPALATGFVLLPPRLREAVAATRRTHGQPVSLITQRAVADYLAAGALTRHTQRMRQLYRRRRSLVVEALGNLPGAHVHPMDGGLHVVVELDSGNEGEVITTLADSGVLVTALSEYWAGAASLRGLVFGFGAVPDDELTRGLAQIREALCAQRPR
ncbi:MAG: PLP-dependent aminotransferase family protein [Dermatophilus congolensis]|nr:PLP-dependent aminotransferase family protein [Dermatophilus congolensis]